MKNMKMNDERKQIDEQVDKLTEDQIDAEQPGAIEEDISLYPLRDPSEDPRWAVRVVWTWVIIGLFLLAFIVTLFILGFWFD
jgi:hypothetical protein